MSGLAHTPGPWEVYDGISRDDHWHRHACVWSTSAEHLVAYTDFMTAETAVANARLIAAAPDLLAALKFIAEFRGKTLIAPSLGPDCDQAHQLGANKAFEQAADAAMEAIAKAKGAAS